MNDSRVLCSNLPRERGWRQQEADTGPYHDTARYSPLLTSSLMRGSNTVSTPLFQDRMQLCFAWLAHSLYTLGRGPTSSAGSTLGMAPGIAATVLPAARQISVCTDTVRSQYQLTGRRAAPGR